MQRLNLGLDIGTRRLRLVECSLDDEQRIVVLQSAERELRAGVVSGGHILDPIAVVEALQDALRAIGRRRSRWRREPCATSIGPEIAVVGRAQLRRVYSSARQARRAARYRAAEFNSWPIDDCELRTIIDPEHPARPVVAKVLRRDLQQRIAILRDAGLRPRIEHYSFPLRRMFPAHDAILDIGHVGAVLTIYNDLAPTVVRLRAGGGEAITSAIAQASRVEALEAEQIKQRSTDPSGGAAARTLEVLADEVRGEVRRMLSRHGHIVRSIVLVGNGARYPGIAPAIEERVKIPVALARLGLTSPVFPPEVLAARSPDLALAIGSALFSAKVAPVTEPFTPAIAEELPESVPAPSEEVA